MRKIVAILLAVCLLLTCAGCRRKPDAMPTGTTAPMPTEPASSADPQPTDPPFTADQEHMISISVPAVTESTEAEDGTTIFQYLYQNISLTCEDPAVADKIILDLLNRIDGTRSTAGSILDSAKAGFSGGSWTPYLCRVIYDPMRIDSGVLSLFGNTIQYTGTSHPVQTCPSVSYDMVTGNVLTLPGILAIDNAGDKLCAYVLEALADIKEEKYLYPDYVSTVTDRLSGDLSRENSWYFTPTGLCFYFLPYEIAPYSSGVVTVEVSYNLLPGVIADAYFPPEREEIAGTVKVTPFAVEALEQFTQFPEVVLESGAEKYLLYTEGLVYNVRLEVGGLSYGGSFAPDYIAFAAYSLTPGDALVIEADIPEDTPRLRLTYTAGGETVSVFLMNGTLSN